MILVMPKGSPVVRIRAMYPAEEKRPRQSDAAGWYYLTAPKEIALDASMPPPQQAAILLHEIIHAVWDDRKMPKRVTEESACTHLGVALAEIIRDNPEIVAALGLALTEGVPIVGASN